MSAEVVRWAASAMRREHGPEHKRHAMWSALADWLDDEAIDLTELYDGSWHPSGHATAVARAYLEADR